MAKKQKQNKKTIVATFYLSQVLQDSKFILCSLLICQKRQDHVDSIFS